MLRLDKTALDRHLNRRLLCRVEAARMSGFAPSMFQRLDKGVQPKAATVRKLLIGLGLTVERAVAEGILVESVR